MIFSNTVILFVGGIPFAIFQYRPELLATMKNTDDFHYKGKPSHATTTSTLFALSKDEWDTLVSP